MKEFKTAVRAVETPEKELTFTVDGTELTAYMPRPEQLAVLMAATGRHASLHTQIAGVIDFFVEVMDEDSQAYLRDRLLDRNDPFGLDEVESIIEWMVEEWTGRPTPPPSVSTRSRNNGGRKSTRPTSKSTSSKRARTAS
jgi:hypothetical protein